MSVSGGKITAPIGVADVAKALGTNSSDVGTLCTSEKINKWSKHKPLQYSKVTELEESDYHGSDYHWGLVPPEITLADDAKTLVEAYKATNWEYLKPDLSKGHVARLTDFDKYYHNSEPVIRTGVKKTDAPILVNQYDKGNTITIELKTPTSEDGLCLADFEKDLANTLVGARIFTVDSDKEDDLTAWNLHSDLSNKSLNDTLAANGGASITVELPTPQSNDEQYISNQDNIGLVKVIPYLQHKTNKTTYAFPFSDSNYFIVTIKKCFYKKITAYAQIISLDGENWYAPTIRVPQPENWDGTIYMQLIAKSNSKDSTIILSADSTALNQIRAETDSGNTESASNIYKAVEYYTIDSSSNLESVNSIEVVDQTRFVIKVPALLKPTGSVQAENGASVVLYVSHNVTSAGGGTYVQLLNLNVRTD